MMSMDVAGRDRRHAQRRGEVAQERVPPRVAALVRTLQLDEETVAAECARKPPGCVRVPNREAVTGTPGEADEPLVQLLQQRLFQCRLGGRLRLLALRSGVRMRRRDQPAEVRVPL